MFDNLSDKFDRAFKVLKGHGQITDINVAETLKEVRRALIDADVNFKIAKDFTDRVKTKALGENVLTAVEPGQLMIKITRDELAALMGSEHAEINLSGNPTIVLIAGLQGSGKTTFSAKLANYLKTKKSKNPMLVACDIYRPAAINQLHVVGEQVGVEVFSDKESKDVVSIAQRGVERAKSAGHDVVIIDTAGRLHIDDGMMKEIAALKKSLQPQETLFVVDSMTGQDAVNTAKAFNEQIDYDGVVLTKLDGDTRGGAALTIRSVVKKPLKFIGTGEKLDALDVFYPDRMADRILGMGDVISLVERAQEQFDEDEARRVQKKIARNQFNFNDFVKQIKQVKKMGNIKDLMGMIPGVGKMMKDIDIDDNAFDIIEVIVGSMTPEEKEFPHIINGNRRKRIAAGSGTSVEDVNKLLKQFNDMSKMMKMMQSGNAQKSMQKMKSMMPNKQ